MALTVSMKLTGDAKGAVAAAQAADKALADLRQAAHQAAATARETAMGFGDVEERTRSASAAASLYGGQFRAMSAAIDEAEAHTARLNDEREREAALLAQTRAAINPYVAAQQQYAARQNEITAALKAGAVSEMEAARARDLARTAYARHLTTLRQATAATREHTGAVRLQGYQVANLFQQFQDVGTQLAMGTNPFIILAQQGPQITSAMGGVKNALQVVRPFFTAATISAGALTAGLVTGAAAWNSYLTSVKAVQAAAQGRGRALGISPGDLETIAAAGAEAGDISRRTAREAERAFLNTGRIGTEVMQGLIAASRDYAAAMGMDVTAAIDDLAAKFADPAKGAEELSRQLDFIDANTIDYIRTLASQNKLTEAQQVLLQALPARLASANKGVTMLGRAWYTVSTGASDAWDWMGRAIDRAIDGPEASADNLARMKARAAQIRDTLTQTSGFTDLTLGPATQQMQAELAQLESWIASMEARLARTRADAEKDIVNRRSAAAGDAARALTPGAIDMEGLRRQQAALKAVLDEPSVYAGKNNLDEVAAAYDRVTRAIDTWLTPAERAAEADRLATAALTARTPAERAAIAEQQKRLDLAGQTITRTEAEAQALSAGTHARRQAEQAIADQNDGLAVTTRATLAVADAYLQSGQAAQAATARREALTEALRSGGDVTVQTRLRLQEMAAAEAESGAQAAQQANAQADAQRALNDAVLSGRATAAQAAQQAQLDAALRPLLIAQANAEGEARSALERVIEALRGAYARLNEEQARTAAADTLQAQADDLEMLRLEASLVWESADMRAEQTAQLRAEQQARRAGIDLRSKEFQQILKNERLIAAETATLERQREVYGEFASSAESALARVGDQLASGKLDAADWGDTVASVVQDVLRQFYRLAVTAPLMNSLFGTNYATIDDAGGIIGGLFHTGGIVGAPANENRLVPSALFHGAPRFHSGGLLPGEVPIIAQAGEEVLTAADPRHIRNIRAATRGAASPAQPPEVAVSINIHEAPGTTARVSQRRDESGMSIDIFVEQLEDKLGSRAAAGQGSLVAGLSHVFGVPPTGGKQRRG
jgi:hypothetical protein